MARAAAARNSMGACGGGCGRHHRGAAAGQLPGPCCWLATSKVPRCVQSCFKPAAPQREGALRWTLGVAVLRLPPPLLCCGLTFVTARPAGACWLQTRAGSHHPGRGLCTRLQRKAEAVGGGSPAPRRTGAGGAKSTRIGLYGGGKGLRETAGWSCRIAGRCELRRTPRRCCSDCPWPLNKKEPWETGGATLSPARGRVGRPFAARCLLVDW